MTKEAVARDGPGFYLSKREIMRSFGRSDTCVKGWIRGIAEQMEKGRYGRYAMLDSSGQKHVNEYVLIDYIKYQKMLEQPWKYTERPPEFDPQEIARICPIEKEVILESDICMMKGGRG